MATVSTQTPVRGTRAVGADRRTSDRFSVNSGAACTFASPVVEDFGPVLQIAQALVQVGRFVVRAHLRRPPRYR